MCFVFLDRSSNIQTKFETLRLFCLAFSIISFSILSIHRHFKQKQTRNTKAKNLIGKCKIIFFDVIIFVFFGVCVFKCGKSGCYIFLKHEELFIMKLDKTWPVYIFTESCSKIKSYLHNCIDQSCTDRKRSSSNVVFCLFSNLSDGFGIVAELDLKLLSPSWKIYFAPF